MKNPTQVILKGIKCDAAGCGYSDMDAEFGDGRKWLGVPCPECGAPLLTEEDLDAIELILGMSELVNKAVGKVPDDEEFVHVPLTLRGDGTVSVDDAPPAAAHSEDCDYIKSICERDDKHRRVPVRPCDCPAKEDAACQ